MPIRWITTGSTVAPAIVGSTDWTQTTATATTTASALYNAYTGTQQTATTTSSTFWAIWEDDYVQQPQYIALAQQRVMRTSELIAALEEQRRQLQERYDRERMEREVALDRSRELLLAHLTPEQRETFERRKWFIVRGGKSEKQYRIRTESYTGNIDEFDGERIAWRLCGHLSPRMPLYDHHFAQMISLRFDEERFVSICNRSAA